MQTKLLNISNPPTTPEEDWSKENSRLLQRLSHSTATQKQIERLTLQMLLSFFDDFMISSKLLVSLISFM